MSGRREETALGVARARFVEGLPRRTRELKGALALLTGSPDDVRSREELRRRLHALFASAQVFRITALADALKACIGHLDSARDGSRAVNADELAELARVTGSLAALAGEQPAVGASVPAPPPASAPPESLDDSMDDSLDDSLDLAFSTPSTPPKTSALGTAPASYRVPAVDPATTKPTVVPPPAQQAPAKRPSIRPMPSPAPQTPFGLSTVVSVLVIDDAKSEAKIRAALPTDHFELMSATDPEDALRLARSAAPDVVVVGLGVLELPEVDLITRLRSDPLHGHVPVLLLYPVSRALDDARIRALGADAGFASPIDAESFAKTIAELSGLEGDGGPSARLGDLTVTELADRIAAELRRGLVDSVERGKELVVPLGVGSEVIAAAWSTIARVRSHVADRTDGRVQFRDPHGRGAPAFIDTAVLGEDIDDISLVGRKVVVADDDPAVLWFFAQVLKEAGAEVHEAVDGLVALELARRVRPEVVLSDILMPRMDGMALTRELSRDPAVCAVPVILLSWKEDFIQRMRELRSGAHGYLRKEDGTEQILRRVREALRPQANLERLLRGGGEVRGRIENHGVAGLLRTVGATRPDARVLVRDAWSLFEVDVREGALVDVTRTASDGGFARGERVLPLLIGVVDGRFTVVDAQGAVRPTVEGTLDEVLGRVCTEVGALVDSVSGAGLSQAAELTLDEGVVESIIASSPGRAGEVLEGLRAGVGPHTMLVSGKVEPQLLESVLVDLARRGGVKAILGASGEDRLEEARARRLSILEPADAADEPLDAALLTLEPPRPSVPTESDDLLADLVLEAPSVPPPSMDALADVAPAVPPPPAPVTPTAAPSIPPPEETLVLPRRKKQRSGGAIRKAGFALALGALCAAGYYGVQSLRGSDAPAIAASAPDATPTHAATSPAAAGAPAEAPPAHLLAAEARLYGRSVAGVEGSKVAVGPGQGLLRVEADAPLEEVDVRIADRSLGHPPLDIALDEGVVELVFKRGDELRYRYVHVSAGQSRVVPVP